MDPPLCVNCTVEDHKIMKGLELVFSDKLNEAEEYFEAMRPGSLRYSLHHAEVATYIALISCDESDIQRAVTLLMETEVLAGQLAQKYRTHSNIRKMNATVSSIKSWALGKISKKYSPSIILAKASTLSTEDGQDNDPITREEKVHNHRCRRARLWALLIQAECYLMVSLLQIVGMGESWSSVVKVGYSLRRTWGLYQHCLNKLRQITKEWIAMGGTFDFQGDVKNMEEEESSSSDSDNEDCANQFEGAAGDSTGETKPSPSTSSLTSAYVHANDESISYESISSPPMVLDMIKAVKEDAELFSLRIGTQFGEGAFNLILSLIPSSYQRALEVMCFPADREKGVRLLRTACSQTHPIASLASIMLLYYHTVIIGLLPYSSEHAREAHQLINTLPSSWNSCSLFRMLHSRLERYERHLDQSIVLVYLHPENPYSITERGNTRKLRCLMLDELGWCLLLQGKFSDAADCFGTLLQESVCFKPYYAFLQSSCLWEAIGNSHQQQAGILLKEIPTLIGSKKKQQLTPLEQYALQISSKFIASTQAPLFPALEVAAVFNGFQFMDEASLELHKRCIEEVLKGRTQTHGSAQNAMDLLTGEDHAISTTEEVASRSTLHYEHKWTKSSKMICRFLLGVCQKNLGEVEKADDNFRYVISHSEVMCGNVVPYSCYELASMLLEQDPSSPEGIKLLEQCVVYPPHEFQGRLKLVVGELFKRYRGSSTTVESCVNTQQGSIKTVSGQLKAKFSI